MITPVLAGDMISLPVCEIDGARTGFRVKPATSNGYLVETGDESIFLAREDVEDAVALMKAAKRRK